MTEADALRIGFRLRDLDGKSICPPPAHFGRLAIMDDASGPVGRRVIVTGMAGSGKSTFSTALSARTGLPLIHLDFHYWKPGWVKPSDDEWQVKQRSLLAGDAWIADGNYHETLDLRLERADTVVVLYTPWWVCAGRALVRGIRRPVGTVLPEGCSESAIRRLRDEWRLAGLIWWHRHREPERERAIISEHGQHVALHVLSSRQAARAFLAECGGTDLGPRTSDRMH
jgi:adenylate kinase family enzyme